MDELYTMDRPRQIPLLPKICGAATSVLRAGLGKWVLLWFHSGCEAIRTPHAAGYAIRAATSERYQRPIECEGKDMKTVKRIVTGIAAGVGLMGVTLLAASNPTPRTLNDQVRHEILMVPYIGVFDNLSYRVDNGVVTLFGQVTQPVRKLDVERAVKNISGVTAVNDQIEVLPLSRFDDQIRFRTLRAMLRSAPLDKYFRGVQPGIRIIVKNGNVTLDGVVLNIGDRQLAYMAANQVPGVFSVTNNLQTEVR